MDLVDDDGFDGAKRLGGLGGQQQVERLGGGDEDVGRIAGKTGPFALWGISGPDADGWFVERNSATASHVGNAGERRPEVALDVDGECLERRNVDDAAAASPRGLN